MNVPNTYRLPAAYLGVVVISSTSPLGIVWSSESVPPIMAVMLRMLIAAVLGTLILLACRIRLPMTPTALRLYSYSALGIFGGMLCSYAAARYIGSGLMSLLFGLSPIISGLLAQRILGEARFNWIKLLALALAIGGLTLVCWDKLAGGGNAIIGIGLLLTAMLIFSLSGVMVKSITININPLATTLGALYFSIPLFFIAWLLFDGQLNTTQWTDRSIMAIVYLGVFGSLLNYVAYFYILQKLPATTVALIALITPTFAIALGAMLNREVISHWLIIGGVFVFAGLALYQWGDQWLKIRDERVDKCVSKP